MSRLILLILVLAALVVIVLLATGFINIDQTRQARLPDVDINAQGGQLPAFDVDTKTVRIESGDDAATAGGNAAAGNATIELPAVTVTNQQN